MATHDYIISNASGAAVRADLNNALAAIATNNSSATEPTTTYAYQWWADTGSTPTVMKLRNAANSGWVTLFQLDGEWSLIPFENGTAAAPSIYFKDSGTDTGLFSPGVDQVGITTGGAVRLTTSTTAFTGTLPWQGQNGTAAAPALSFSGDPNTGVYNVGADQLGISTNGTLRLTTSTTAFTGTLPWQGQNGTAAAPALSFSGDPNTGVYNVGADQLGISTGGTLRLTTSTTAITSTLPVVYPLGAVGTPSVTFTGDLNTGIWSPAADTIAISTNGAERSRVDSSGRLLVGTTSARTNFFNNASTYSATQQIEGTGASGSARGALAVINNSSGDDAPLLILAKSRGTTIGSNTLCANNEYIGHIAFQANDGAEFVELANIIAQVDGTPGANDMPGRLVFATTADGTASPTERMRIKNDGIVIIGPRTAFGYHAVSWNGSAEGTSVFGVTDDGTNQGSAYFKLCSGGGDNAANCAINVKKNNTTSRSINAGGTINASGADYAEYMMKDGDFDIAKGAICGVTINGLLTLNYADTVSFVVKSTNPSYVGGDTWGSEDVVGKKPEENDVDALAQWEANLEVARQKVDRIAFAGQVPVNVMGATPGQYIVPVDAADGGIEGIAKNEADLTLAEYMRAVGKVVAIEDDGRARIIVKVA